LEVFANRLPNHVKHPKTYEKTFHYCFFNLLHLKHLLIFPKINAFFSFFYPHVIDSQGKIPNYGATFRYLQGETAMHAKHNKSFILLSIPV